MHAVRGEVVKIARNGKGSLSITVRPARDFSEATVTARENEWIGSAATRGTDADLLGLLVGDDARDDERITAAELEEGDIVSVIYDPANQNHSLEIYLH